MTNGNGKGKSSNFSHYGIVLTSLNVDGISLTDSKLEDEWKQGGLVFICGDWILITEDPKKSKFELRWSYETIEKKNGTLLEKSVIIDCHKISRSQFSITRLYRNEEELYILMP